MGKAMSVTDKIFEIIAEQAVLETSDVTMESTLEDLGIDSLGLVESIFAIEEEFDITVPFNANEPTNSDFDISSVAKIIEGVERFLKEQAG
jgi:acyl carrier protein